MTVTVLVADDQPLMRSALRGCLDAEPDLQVVGEAGTGHEAVRIAERTAPDVVVMDIGMPKMDGIEATRRICAAVGHRPQVLVVTTFDTDENIIEALRAGAKGFLVKDAPAEEIIRAVRLLGEGAAFLSPSITRRLLDLRARELEPHGSAEREAALVGITTRERTVLGYVARALTNADIAVAMDLAPSSIKTHVGHLLAKLGMTDRAELVVFAYEHRLVRPGAVPDPEVRTPVPRPPLDVAAPWLFRRERGHQS